jgi:hypothetical protein
MHSVEESLLRSVIQSAAKPTLPQEEKEQAPERERVRASNE